MIKELTRLANHLDAKGLRKEADYLDTVINKVADEGGLAIGPQQILEQNVVMSGQFTRAQAIEMLGGGDKGEQRYDEIMSRSPDDPCKVRQQTVYDNVLSYVRDNMQEGEDKNMLIDWLRMTANAPTNH